MPEIKKLIKNQIYGAYRRLPLTAHSKQNVKNILFSCFGFLFKHLNAYKVWRQQQEQLLTGYVQAQEQARRVAEQTAKSAQEETKRLAEQAVALEEERRLANQTAAQEQERRVAEQAAAQAAVLAATEEARRLAEQVSGLSTGLPPANGVWEWEDYPEVRARIAQAKTSNKAGLPLEKFEIFDIQESEFSDVVAELHFEPPGPAPRVSIILPVFNNVKLTLECLVSISRQVQEGLSLEIIVADDGSSDETQSLMQLIPNIKYIRGEQNVGFLLNCNRALAVVTGEFTVYLNNDVQVTAGWLEALLSTFESYDNVGVVGPKFVYPSGHLQEAGAALSFDGTSTMVGFAEHPDLPRFNYTRRVDYVSGACLLVPTRILKDLGGFSEDFLPCYCEDSDLCLNIRAAGYHIYYNPDATIIHHLSKTTAAIDNQFKMDCIAKNVTVLNQKWGSAIEKAFDPRLITFFLPQFHPIPENDLWWGKGFTEWTNVSKAWPNFVGHYQPRIPADHGYYDLRLLDVLKSQAELAQRYGIHGFCFYYYWFDGKRLLERPVEQLLLSEEPDIPFCLCWANENWTRRWDGQEQEVLIAQAHTDEDDIAVIHDLIRFFKDDRYIKIDERPLLVVYRVLLFPDFAKTAATWRKVCREQGIGEIYIAMVESFELSQSNTHPSVLGCDAAVEFPSMALAEVKPPSGQVINPEFAGHIADYRDVAVNYAVRPAPGYTRFKGVMPGWDNTARRQNVSYCFERASPGAFQAWLEESIVDTREQNFGDERLIFINAWNEWAEGAYLEPDRRYGHAYLQAVSNALDASRLLKKT